MSIEEAQAEVGYPIAVPNNLGNPDDVYLQETQLPMTILVWYETDGSRLLLYIIDSESIYFKFTPEEPEVVEVQGRRGYWFDSPHLTEFVPSSSSLMLSVHVDGNVLVWDRNGITYRLEGDMTQAVALEIAESMP